MTAGVSPRRPDAPLNSFSLGHREVTRGLAAKTPSPCPIWSVVSATFSTTEPLAWPLICLCQILSEHNRIAGKLIFNTSVPLFCASKHEPRAQAQASSNFWNMTFLELPMLIKHSATHVVDVLCGIANTRLRWLQASLHFPAGQIGFGRL